MTIDSLKRLYQKTFKRDIDKTLRMLFDSPKTFLDLASDDPLNSLTSPAILEEVVNFSVKYGYASHSTLLRNSVEVNFAKAMQREKALLLPYRPTLFDDVCQLFQEYGCKVFSEKTQTHMTPKVLHESLQIAKGPHVAAIKALLPHTRERQNIEEFASVTKKHQALLLVDDSHTFTLENEGLGSSARTSGVDIVVGSIPKSYGFFASYIATSDELLRILQAKDNTLFSQSLSTPALLGAVSASLTLLPEMTSERAAIEELSQSIHTRLTDLGYDTTLPNPYQVGVHFTHLDAAQSFYRTLSEEGALVREPIKPNPYAKATILISPSRALSKQRVLRVFDAIPPLFSKATVEAL